MGNIVLSVLWRKSGEKIMATKMDCLGCGYPLMIDKDAVVCPNCGTVADGVDAYTNEERQRLNSAASYRRVGRFDDSQQELETLLENNEELPEALFGCFLNAYEITEYAFEKDNNVKTCKCHSASERSVTKHPDLQSAMRLVNSRQTLKQWENLSKTIELQRSINSSIKRSIPKYRAILACAYENPDDIRVTRGIYDILSKETDVFFMPVTLKKVCESDRPKYLMQVLKNPEKAPLMFVVYSDAFDYRNKASSPLYNIAGQCREFAKVHTATELFSVTCDCEPSPIMKRASIKTIRCKDFDEESYENIAYAILDNIASTYDDEEYERYDSGEAVVIDEEKGLSPIINPI